MGVIDEAAFHESLDEASQGGNGAYHVGRACVAYYLHA